MLHIKDGKPTCLPPSFALLVNATDSDANVSISAVTRAERICIRLDHPNLTRSSSDPASSNRWTSLMRPATVKGPVPVCTFF
ncbi:hypothetical protein NPIL_379021 [Nephila pilipes]|uniref:Uncharacterized protein n=1 Tax=Nephila pilipes TaxID=299642 RepID=A0A8X6QTC2_NEPPI|nr:hypothetical protein NPIL_379021 [Nephila pilipes]